MRKCNSFQPGRKRCDSHHFLNAHRCYKWIHFVYKKNHILQTPLVCPVRASRLCSTRVAPRRTAIQHLLVSWSSVWMPSSLPPLHPPTHTRLIQSILGRVRRREGCGLSKQKNHKDRIKGDTGNPFLLGTTDFANKKKEKERNKEKKEERKKERKKPTTYLSSCCSLIDGVDRRSLLSLLPHPPFFFLSSKDVLLTSETKGCVRYFS